MIHQVGNELTYTCLRIAKVSGNVETRLGDFYVVVRKRQYRHWRCFDIVLGYKALRSRLRRIASVLQAVIPPEGVRVALDAFITMMRCHVIMIACLASESQDSG